MIKDISTEGLFQLVEMIKCIPAERLHEFYGETLKHNTLEEKLNLILNEYSKE